MKAGQLIRDTKSGWLLVLVERQSMTWDTSTLEGTFGKDEYSFWIWIALCCQNNQRITMLEDELKEYLSDGSFEVLNKKGHKMSSTKQLNHDIL